METCLFFITCLPIWHQPVGAKFLKEEHYGQGGALPHNLVGEAAGMKTYFMIFAD